MEDGMNVHVEGILRSTHYTLCMAPRNTVLQHGSHGSSASGGIAMSVISNEPCTIPLAVLKMPHWKTGMHASGLWSGLRGLMYVQRGSFI